MRPCFNEQMSSKLDQLLRDASHLLGCESVAIRCNCANLETVYVEREYDQLLITDRRDTYVYLGGADDDDVVSLLPEEQARAICAGHGVDLDSSDAEAWPRIQREVGETEDVRQVVAAVAAAIDEVFCAANKYLD